MRQFAQRVSGQRGHEAKRARQKRDVDAFAQRGQDVAGVRPGATTKAARRPTDILASAVSANAKAPSVTPSIAFRW